MIISSCELKPQLIKNNTLNKPDQGHSDDADQESLIADREGLCYLKSFNPIFKYVGIAAGAVYIVFTFTSHLFNTALTPMTDWLSNYGSPVLNPSGALFYNLGCILTAAILVVFYFGISQWYRGGRVAKKYTVSYVCAQVSGLAASCCLVVASLFPIGTSSLHNTFGMMNMIGINCFMSFLSIAIFMHPHVNKAVGILGIFTATFNIITTNAFKNMYIAEWIYFSLFIIYIVLITINYDKLGWLEVEKERDAGAVC